MDGGLALFMVVVLLALATFVSEDLACIGAGLLVADGRLGFGWAALACFAGIFVGDVGLFLAGKLLGRAALHWPPFRWVLTPEKVERGCAFFERRGLTLIAASRFLPGARLPTYFAAGVLGTPILTFSLYFALAAVVWTPLLVGIAAVAGTQIQEYLPGTGAGPGLLAVLLVVVALLFFARLIPRLMTHRGRRLLRGRWQRWRRWEFWPVWVFYPPVVAYVLWLGLRHRCLTLFTAANPGIWAGGVIGESKIGILEALGWEGGHVARALLVPAELEPEGRLQAALGFMEREGLEYPVVLKPDTGQRGVDVAVVRSESALRSYLEQHPRDTLVQEFAPGAEFGVFYVRLPDEKRGRIFSITAKMPPVLTGDGARNLEELILDDARAVTLAELYFKENAARLAWVPAEGEEVPLVEVGTHCRGAIFRDGNALLTPALEDAIHRLSARAEGFYFGRYDLRTPDLEAFQRGENFKVVELNGVTSEAAHIYDPEAGLTDAYRTLFEQWRLAFEIGHQNRARGHAVTSARELLALVVRFRRARRSAYAST